MPEFYCHRKFQPLKEYVNKENGKKSFIGRCSDCKKHFVEVDNIPLEGRPAKRIYNKVKAKIKQNTEIYDKFRSKTFINDNFTYFITCQKRIKSEGEYKLVQYQAEKRFNSGYSTKFKTLESIKIS